MQVFISDVHLTDGTSGYTINAGAFELFRDNLKNLLLAVNKSGKPATELKIVLLGDIFDVIRSTKWLDVAVRPWSLAGSAQEAVVQSIVTDILAKNQKSLKCFDELRQFAGKMNIPFELQYVIGNHDWLINRYPNIRKIVALALGITSPPAGFPTEIFDSAYGTIARHGDIYDEFNYMGDRDKSSIGDAIVIELLNRFPIEVAQNLNGLVTNGMVTSQARQNIVDKLKELDNVRPLLNAPSWVLMVSSRASNPIRQAIENAWQKCVDDFFKVPFIKSLDIPFWPDTIDMLQITLQLSSHTSKWMLEKIVELKNRFYPNGIEGDYHKKAWAESKIRAGEARYVLYGHTHEHLIVPMDQIPLSNGDIEDKIYFNTGTWRQTWNKVVFDNINREFIGWKVCTYIAFYNDDENKDYAFEVWNGALG